MLRANFLYHMAREQTHGAFHVPMSLIEAELQNLIKLEKRHVEMMKNGVRVEQVCRANINKLILQGSAARFLLAKDFLVVSDKLRKMRPPSHRFSISRSYYAMYHAARSLAFVYHNGDNYQDHKELYKWLPPDLPEVEAWQNSLKDARVRRNEADYDPYPVGEDDFKAISNSQLKSAIAFCAQVEAYLKEKGCAL